jgi:chromosome partitioning protein
MRLRRHRDPAQRGVETAEEPAEEELDVGGVEASTTDGHGDAMSRAPLAQAAKPEPVEPDDDVEADEPPEEIVLLVTPGAAETSEAELEAANGAVSGSVVTAATGEARSATASPEPTARGRTGSLGSEANDLLQSVSQSPRRQRELPRVLAVANQKGGVGKTTTTVNLGAALAELDYRVLVIDLDPQGNATTGLGIDARNFELSMYDVIMRDTPIEDCVEATSVRNLFVAPATIDLAGVEIELVPAFSRELKLKKAIDAVVEDFDFVLIDCPPSLGLITVNGLAAASEVLVPIQCEYYALEGLGQLLRNVHLVATNLNSTLDISTIVLTMFDARTRLAVDVATEVREHFSDRVCRSVIPRTVRLSEAPSFGQPITVFDPSSRGAVAYRELAKEVSNGAAKRTG